MHTQHGFVNHMPGNFPGRVTMLMWFWSV